VSDLKGEDPFANCTHGKRSTYSKGCRCDACREARRSYQNKYRQAKREGAEVPGSEVTHGLGGYTNWGCRCESCKKAYRSWRREHRDTLAAERGTRWWEKRDGSRPARVKRIAARRQGATLEQATRHRFQWTGPELELASRPDLTAVEVAQLLGRSYSAVKTMRSRLKKDPKIVTLAGLRRSERPGEEPMP